jgi:hypothetical protein
MTAALLIATGVLVVGSAACFVVSHRRGDPAAALAGMTVMIAAALPAVVHAGLTS